MRLRINSRILSEALSSNSRTKAAAFYLFLVLKFPHKAVKYNPENLSKITGVSKSSIYNYVKIMKQMKLAKIENGYLLLSSLREQSSITGKKKEIFTDKLTLKEIFYNLKVIPILSNRFSQHRIVEKKKDIVTLTQAKNKGFYLNKSERRRLKYGQNKYSITEPIIEPNLSNNGVMRVLNVKSSRTAQKYKKKSGIFFNRRYQSLGNMSKELFLQLRRTDEIPFYSKWFNGNVFYDLSCEMSFDRKYNGKISVSVLHYVR